MKNIATFSLAFVALAFVTSASYAEPRNAGSKIRNEADYGTSDAIRSTARYYYAPTTQAPVIKAQPQQAAVQSAAPTHPSVNATAAVDKTRSGTRTFSVEPQTTAPTMTYRNYAPRRGFSRGNWDAGRKILGNYEY